MRAWCDYCDYCDNGCEHCQPTQDDYVPPPAVNDDAYVCVAILSELLEKGSPGVPVTHVQIGGEMLPLAEWNTVCDKYAAAGHETVKRRVQAARAKQEAKKQGLLRDKDALQRQLQLVEAELKQLPK